MEPSSDRDGSTIPMFVKVKRLGFALGMVRHVTASAPPPDQSTPRPGATKTRQNYDILTTLGVHQNPLFRKRRMDLARQLLAAGVDAEAIFCYHLEVAKNPCYSINNMGAFLASKIQRRLTMKTDVEWDQIVEAGLARVRSDRESAAARKRLRRSNMATAERIAHLKVEDLEGQAAAASMFAMWRAGQSIESIALSFSVDEEYAHAMVMAYIRRGGQHLRAVP